MAKKPKDEKPKDEKPKDEKPKDEANVSAPLEDGVETAPLAGELVGPEDASPPPARDPATGRLSLQAMRDLGFVETERTDAEGVTIVVTKGMRKLRFPGDEVAAAALQLHELDGSVPPAAGAPTSFGADAAANHARKLAEASKRKAKG